MPKRPKKRGKLFSLFEQLEFIYGKLEASP
jgi:hypothetical protein